MIATLYTPAPPALAEARTTKAADEVFAAVRVDTTTGDEFVDLGTTSHHREGVQVRVRESGGGQVWRGANPVRRIGRFEMREVRG